MKYLVFILFLFVGCEKETENTGCKECTYIEMGIEHKVFVCGEELAKYERDNLPCVKISSKN